MRDYARLIVERYIFEFPEECDNVDINTVRPPYRSHRIPVVSRQDYYEKDAKDSGFNSISLSMHPNHPDCGPGLYGDFGRYVFQAVISKFEDVDISNLYHYAMQFIRDELGYDDRLLGQYDCFSRRSYYDRHEVKKTERIGKKYQWIALYNILARLSDVCLLKEWGEDSHSYSGPWEPYVRDFDPTINCNFLCYPESPLFELNQDSHEEFLSLSQTEPEIIEWSKNPSSFFAAHAARLILTDSTGMQWVSLLDSQELSNKENVWNSNTRGPASGSQIIWTISRAYFVKKANLAAFRDSLTGKDIRKLDLPESNSAYQLFNREYSWAPGILEIFGDGWFDCEIETGEQVVIHHEEALPKFYVQADENDLFGDELSLESQGWDQAEDVKESIGKISPAFCRYLWEEEYDASQKDTTAFDVPCKELLISMELEQKLYDGYYFTKEGILAAFDGHLQNANHGLIIRKDLLDKFLVENDLSLLWSCIGEKQYFLGDNKQIWGEWCGLFYLDGDRAVGEMHPQEN